MINSILTFLQEKETLTVILDKGLLAVILLAAGLASSRILEKFKASQSWTTEIARERILLFKRLVEDSHAIQLIHMRFRWSQLTNAPDKFQITLERTTAVSKLNVAAAEADLLLSPDVARAYSALVNRAQELLDVPASKEAIDAEAKVLEDLIRKAGAELKKVMDGVVSTRILKPGEKLSHSDPVLLV